MITSTEIHAASLLIVDDVEANVLLLEGMLRKAGYTAVSRTLDSTKVCELHRQHGYDLILLDLQMPRMDGFTVMEGLHEIESDAYLPVIVLTAEPGHKVRALKAGARDFISKPFDLPEVLMRVRNLVEVRLLHRKLLHYATLLEDRNRLLGEQLIAEQNMSSQLEIANRALAAANEELDQFAYAASHDLRAPLRGITNLAGLIEDDLGAAATPGVLQRLKMLQGRARRLEALIEGILAYSRAGRVFEEPACIDSKALVMEAVELVAPPAGVSVEIVDPLPEVAAERVPLLQILMNLIHNAIKHGCEGGGRVRVSARDEGLHYRFSVQDFGPGIAPEYHDRIFGIFQTLASRDKVEGAGIGLSVVKKLVESRGGTIRVESQVDAGATFSFTVARSRQAEGSPALPVEATVALGAPHALIGRVTS